MSEGISSLHVESGACAVFHKRFDTLGMTADAETLKIWKLPRGSIVWDAWINVLTADTDTVAANPDITLRLNDAAYEAAPTQLTLVTGNLDAVALLQMTRTAGIATKTTKTNDVELLQVNVADGDSVIEVFILASRPGPEPQSATS